MKFSTRSKIRAGARRNGVKVSSAEIDTLEARLLLTTTPNILSPTGTVTDPTPEFTWEAVDGAESYDLWVTSLETYETVFVRRGETDTSYTATEGELPMGRIRVWARANLAAGGTSDWSPASEATILAAPTLTGPTGTGAGNLTSDNTPEIKWVSPREASRFQIWVTDLTAKRAAEQAAADAGSSDPVDVALHSQQYTVQNRIPVLDVNGNPTFETSGKPILRQVRSFVIPEDPSDPDSAERELDMGRYRIWIRAFDLSGRATGWSTAYTFDVGPDPKNLTPTGPTFQVTPDLTWDTVDRATHYEVYVSEAGSTAPFFRRTIAADTIATRQSTQVIISDTNARTPIVENGNDIVEAFERPLLDSSGNEVAYPILSGSYRFWVRAVNKGEGVPTVFGAWSSSTAFRTIEGPVITAPVPDQGLVTSATPIIEWTPIHGTARYEVLVHKFNSRPPFLEATSTTTSYTFTEDLPAGQYTIWVRALDTRGNPSPWSDPYHITATGGRPVITSPTPGEVTDFPTFTWVGVPEAASYEVWVSHIGVDFTFINVSGISGTSFQPNDPLNPGSVPLSEGNYRIWVRAILSDGSFGAWSAPVDFQGGIPITDSNSLDADTMLTSLTVDLNAETQQAEAEADNWRPEDVAPPTEALENDADLEPPADTSLPIGVSTGEKVADASQLPADLVTELAQQCVDTEWWEASGAL